MVSLLKMPWYEVIVVLLRGEIRLTLIESYLCWSLIYTRSNFSPFLIFDLNCLGLSTNILLFIFLKFYAAWSTLNSTCSGLISRRLRLIRSLVRFLRTLGIPLLWFRMLVGSIFWFKETIHESSVLIFLLFLCLFFALKLKGISFMFSVERRSNIFIWVPVKSTFLAGAYNF